MPRKKKTAKDMFKDLEFNIDIDNDEKIVYIDKFKRKITFNKEDLTFNAYASNYDGKDYIIDIDMKLLSAIVFQLDELAKNAKM